MVVPHQLIHHHQNRIAQQQPRTVSSTASLFCWTLLHTEVVSGVGIYMKKHLSLVRNHCFHPIPLQCATVSNKIVRPSKRPYEAAVERFYSDDGELVGRERPQYIHIRTVLALYSSYLVVHLFSSWLVWGRNQVVYDRNHYFGLGPIRKPKSKLADTLVATVTDTKTTFQREDLVTELIWL